MPVELYDRSPNELYDMHHDIVMMQHRARGTMYLPGIDSDIAEYV